MKRAYEIIGIIDDASTLLGKLSRWMERRSIPPEIETPVQANETTLDRFRPGNTYGQFNERIVRRDVRRFSAPPGFDPREHAGQFGIIIPDGTRIYVQVAIDDEQRCQPSTFDSHIVSLVEQTPEQTSLLDS